MGNENLERIMSTIFPQGSNFVSPPEYDGDAGFDIKMPYTVKMNWRFLKKFELPISVAGTAGTFGFLLPRSSAFRKGIITLGVLDCRYQGRIKVTVISLNPFRVFRAGVAYFQIIFVEFYNPIPQAFRSTRVRGDNGGDTSRKG